MIAEIEALEFTNIDNGKSNFGVLSMQTLKFLSCPICHNAFEIHNASIKSERIHKGILGCSCGRMYKIDHGIILDQNKDIEFKRAEGNIDIKLESEHFAVLKKSGDYLLNKMNKWDHSRGIIFMPADNISLIRGVDRCFRKQGEYFICCTSLAQASVIWQILERQAFEGNATVIVTDHEPPLSPMIPYLVDFDSNAVDFKKSKPLGHRFSLFDHEFKEEVIGFYAKTVSVKHSTYLDRSMIGDQYLGEGYQLDEEEVIGTTRGVRVFNDINGSNEECEHYALYHTKKILFK